MSNQSDQSNEKPNNKWKFSSGNESFEYGNTKGFGDLIQWIRNRKSKQDQIKSQLKAEKAVSSNKPT